VALLAAPAGARKKTYQTAKTAEDFAKLVEKLTPAAEAFAESGTDQLPPADESVRSLYYDPKAHEHIGKALLPEHELAMARLFIAYQVLQPLDRAGDDALLKLRSPLLKLFALCKYQRMPVWPKHKLQRLILPKRRMSQAERRRREEARREFLKEKMAKERSVAKSNRLAFAIQKTLKRLLIRMGDPQADRILLTRFAEEEDSRWTTYRTTLAGVRTEAIRMSKKQAKRYYDALVEKMQRSRDKREYHDPTRPQYSQTDSSSFHREKLWFAQETAQVINLVSTTAREPAVIVPGERRPGKRRKRR
jgi:hypothetical protein